MSAFCAVCAADIVGDPLRRPLGKGDAMVNVCASCDEEHPRGGRYSFDGHRDPSVTPMRVDGGRQVAALGRRRGG